MIVDPRATFLLLCLFFCGSTQTNYPYATEIVSGKRSSMSLEHGREIPFEFVPLSGKKSVELLIWLRQTHAVQSDDHAEIQIQLPDLRKVLVPARPEPYVASVRVHAYDEFTQISVNGQKRDSRKKQGTWPISQFGKFDMAFHNSAIDNIALSYYDEADSNVRIRHTEWRFQNTTSYFVRKQSVITALKVKSDGNRGNFHNGLVKNVQWDSDAQGAYLLRPNQYQAEGNLYSSELNVQFFDDNIQKCLVQKLETTLKFECNPGLGMEGGKCTLCGLGKFKNSFGDTPCEPCEDEKGTEGSGSKVCVFCPAGKYLLNRICRDCDAGTYRTKSHYLYDRTGACLQCAPGKYLEDPGSASADRCLLCDAGTFSTQPGSATRQNCVGCAAGTYSSENRTFCHACPQHKTTPGIGSGKNQSSCVCDYGFRRDGIGNCEACPLGNFNDQLNSVACQECSAGRYQNTAGASTCKSCDGPFYSSAGATQCEMCPPNSNGTRENKNRQACACNPGFTGPNGETCVHCPLGSFKNQSGDLPCTPCEAATFQNKTGSSLCLDCAQHTWSFANASTCTRCGGENSGGFNLRNWSECECLPGYDAIINGNLNLKKYTACNACDPGKYREGYGYDEKCQPCNVGTFSDVLASSSRDNCRPCKPFQFSALGSISCESCRTLSTSVNVFGNKSDCQCNAGFYSLDIDTCQACAKGSFKEQLGNQACSLCPSGKISNVINSTSRDDCQSCAPTFFAMNGSTVCSECPENTISMGLRARKTDCKCLAGYKAPADGQFCSACEPGKFKESTGVGVCAACAGGKYSELQNATDARQCLSCPASKFAPEASSECLPCQDFSDSWGKRSTKADCKCNRGYEGKDGKECVGCVAGKYKIRIGDFRCVFCPEGKYSNVSKAHAAHVCITAPKHSKVVLNATSFKCDASYYLRTFADGRTACIKYNYNPITNADLAQ